MLTGKGLILETQPRSAFVLVQIMQHYGCRWVCFVLNDSFKLVDELDEVNDEMKVATNQVLDWEYVQDVERDSQGAIQVVVANETFEEAVYLGVVGVTLALDVTDYKYLNYPHQSVRVVDVRTEERISVGKEAAIGFWPGDCLFGMTEMSPKKANEVGDMIKAYEWP